MSREGLQPSPEAKHSDTPRERLGSWFRNLALFMAVAGVNGVLENQQTAEAQEKRPNTVDVAPNKEVSKDVLQAIHQEFSHYHGGDRTLEFLSANGKHLTGINFKAREYDPESGKYRTKKPPIWYDPEGYLIFRDKVDVRMEVKAVKFAEDFTVKEGMVITDHAVIFLQGKVGGRLYVGYMNISQDGKWSGGDFNFYKALEKNPLSKAEEADLLGKLKGVEINEKNETFEAPEGVELIEIARSKCSNGSIDNFLQGGSVIKVALGDRTILFDNQLFASLGCHNNDNKPKYFLLKGHCVASNENPKAKKGANPFGEAPAPIVWVKFPRGKQKDGKAPEILWHSGPPETWGNK